MLWIDCEQNTEEWDSLRIGRIGGSEIHTIMANYGKAFGDPAKNLAAYIAAEQKDGIARTRGMAPNEHMKRGHEQEPIARMRYEEDRFATVTNGGYYIVGDDIGVSPDGHVYEDGLVEIKSVTIPVQAATIRRGAFDPKYKWQIAQELKVSGREWIDYISFCAEGTADNQLFVQRIYPADLTEEFNQIDIRVDEFRRLVDKNRKYV